MHGMFQSGEVDYIEQQAVIIFCQQLRKLVMEMLHILQMVYDK